MLAEVTRHFLDRFQDESFLFLRDRRGSFLRGFFRGFLAAFHRFHGFDGFIRGLRGRSKVPFESGRFRLRHHFLRGSGGLLDDGFLRHGFDRRGLVR